MSVRRADRAPRARPSSNATDFTLAVEEEFAILDPETLDARRTASRTLQAAAKGTRARGAPRRRADRLRGRGAHRPLRDLRRGRRARSASGAAQLSALADALGRRASPRPARTRGAAWQDQRIIDTPHYRRNDELLRYVVWRNNTFGLHVHVAHPRRRPRGRGLRRAARASCPTCSPLSASSPFVEGVDTRPALGAHADLHAHVPALRRAGRRTAAGPSFEEYVRILYETGSITEHTQLWWSVRPHLAFPTVEIRICDGAARLGRGAVARRARVRAHGPDRARASTRASRCLSRRPDDRGEPVARDPLRALRRADRPATRARSGPPGRALEQLVEWVQPVADELGAAPYLRGAGGERGRAADRAPRGGRDARGDLRASRSSARRSRSVAEEQPTARRGARRGRGAAPQAEGLGLLLADGLHGSRRSACTKLASDGATSSRRGSRSRRCAPSSRCSRRIPAEAKRDFNQTVATCSSPTRRPSPKRKTASSSLGTSPPPS